MSFYSETKAAVKSKILSLVGINNLILSNSEVPHGVLGVGLSSLDESNKLAEVLTDLNIDHLPSNVSLSQSKSCMMYFREEDLIFAVMDKDAKDVEKAEDTFVKKIDEIEEKTNRFISYNDFIRWYFLTWCPCPEVQKNETISL